MRNYVMGIDIERSGARSEHDTIAIGASVISYDLEKLGSICLKAHTDDTVFEERCMDQFWSKNMEVLENLRYKGDLSHVDRQKEIIVEFQQFRRKWESQAKKDGVELELVADNSVYDGGFLNDLICQYTSDLPIPYSASHPQKYSSFLETHSQQSGFLMAIDPSYTSKWGLSKRINELYVLPKPDEDHDHFPDHDAYTIAFEQQILYRIRDGLYSRK